MPVLRSRLDPDAPETRANHDAMCALVADLRARQDVVAGRGAGGDEALDRAPSRARQAPGPRADRAPPRPGLGLPRALAARGDRALRRRCPGRRHRHGRRPHRGHDLRRRRQRRDRQGRHLLPDDGQEAPARAGDRAREPAAVPVPRRFRRRVPAAPGGRLPGSRPLRAHLLQPGPHVGRRHPAGGAGDGLVHGRRRLRPGDERRDRHRQGHGHDLPRRSAAREGGHRRGRHARGARRLGRPHPAVGGRRPRGARRRARAGARPIDHRQPQSQGARRSPWDRGGIGAAGRRPGRHLRRGLARRPPADPGPRDHRPPRRRVAVPRVQAALRRDARDRVRAPRPATRSRSSPTTGSCSASRRSRARTSSSSPASAGSRSSSSRTSPGSWSVASTRRPASPRTARSS